MCYVCAALGYFLQPVPRLFLSSLPSLLLGHSEIFCMSVYSHNQQGLITQTNLLLLSDHRKHKFNFTCSYKGKIYLKITSNFTFSDLVADQIYNYTKVVVIVFLSAEGAHWGDLKQELKRLKLFLFHSWPWVQEHYRQPLHPCDPCRKPGWLKHIQTSHRFHK